MYKFINLDEAKVVDILLQLEIDFEKKILHGAVTLTVERKLESATHLVSKFLLNDCAFIISGKRIFKFSPSNHISFQNYILGT